MLARDRAMFFGVIVPRYLLRTVELMRLIERSLCLGGGLCDDALTVNRVTVADLRVIDPRRDIEQVMVAVACRAEHRRTARGRLSFIVKLYGRPGTGFAEQLNERCDNRGRRRDRKPTLYLNCHLVSSELLIPYCGLVRIDRPPARCRAKLATDDVAFETSLTSW